MQPNIINCARARISKRGYTGIHIYKTKDGWFVEAICPLSLFSVGRVFSELELDNLFR